MKASFTDTPWLFLLLLALALTLQQVRSDAGLGEYDVNKRQVSVLARDGNLPYQGKRYVGERKDKSDDYMSEDWVGGHGDNMGSNGEPMMFVNPDKRYVGALAKSGDLRFAKQLQDKRDEVDTLIDELLTTEELRRLRLEALRDELLKEKLEAAEEEATDVEKKSVASLARSGNFPFRNEAKKSVSSLARAGLLRPSPFRDYDLNGYGKRGISSLARNGQLPSFGKRGGISSIMRNRLPLHKRSVDDETDSDDADDIDNLLNEIYDSDGKRNLASLARSSNLPYYGKRNMASFMRSGGMSGLNIASKKSMFDDWVDGNDDKRSIPAFFRSPLTPPAEDKRYLGAFVASNRLPYSKQLTATDLENKRNIGAMARNWNLPNSYRFGKRDDGENDLDEFDTSKRYVAALLRQGPIPVGLDTTNLHMEPRNFNVHIDNGDTDDDNSKGMNSDDHEEGKRHIGSIAAQKNYSAMRKKKSVTAEDQITSSENKTNGFSHANHRDKRQALVDFTTSSDEYPMPVLQNAEVTDYDDTASRMSSDHPSTRNKRYFGSLARNGWLPEGHYFKGAASKRHIGALARLGWLPSYRSSRAYSRFGRDVRSPCKRNSPISGEGRWQDSGWSFAADREVPLSQPQLWSSPPLDDDDDDDVSDRNNNDVDRRLVDADYVKRFLLIPAIDNILLRRQYPHWAH